MLKAFYKYLSERAFDYFNSIPLKVGDKYILNLDTDEQVKEYFEAFRCLLEEKNAMLVYSRMDDELFETPSFMTGAKKDIQMVIVPEINIVNAYMTRLRNTISKEGAMFIVCSKPIDSIEGGTESLQKEGLPFHKASMVDDIKISIENSKLTMGEKEVLKFSLNNLINSDTMNTYSLEDFEDTLYILSQNHIGDEDFRKFGLFVDNEVTTFNLSGENAAKQRIEDNYKKYKKIDDVVKYGRPRDDLDGYLSDDLVDKIDKSQNTTNWDDGITYDDIIKSIGKANHKQEPIKITSFEITAGSSEMRNNFDFFVRYEKETVVGRRRPNILIFNKNAENTVQISVGLSDYLGSNDLSIDDKADSSTTAKVDRKKIIIDVIQDKLNIGKVNVKCKDRSEKFDISYCIIDCEAAWFNEVTSCFLVCGKKSKNSPKSLIINCDSDKIVFNRGASSSQEVDLCPDAKIFADYNEEFVLKIDDNSFGDDGSANAIISVNGIDLPVIFSATSPINSSISGTKIEQKKLMERLDFHYRGNNKLKFGTDEYNTREELREILIVEEMIVKEAHLSCTVNGDGETSSEEISVNSDLIKAYKDFLGYFKAHDTLPSLAYYDNDLRELAGRYISAVLDVLSSAVNNSALSQEVRDLLKIGTVFFPAKESIAFSSLHPINVAYQMLIASENGESEIREDVLKKLSANNLVPYIHDAKGKLLKVQEQTQVPHWTFYTPYERKKFRGSRNFVSDLVREKIYDFRDHFSYLFGDIGGNRIIVNAVNMGDCRNLFKGIVSYYLLEIKKNISEAMSIVVNVYDDQKVYNVFEALSRKTALKKILNEMGVKEDNKDYSESEFINIIMSKLRYYRKKKDDEKYEYCHLAFIEMDNKSQIGRSNKFEIRSATMLNGLMSGVTSMYYGANHAYRTGYGCKFNLPKGVETTLLRLTEYYNSMMLAYGTDDPYTSEQVICTSIDDQETEMINKTYDASNWVVFIDPKVDLNYFKNDNKDIMIIHYSDQHTTSSGYDAITVTSKTEQYENILKEFLVKNGLPSEENYQIRKMIDMFNAVNGDWLLKLISSKGNFTKEKISIQSAIKLALAFFKNDNIIWIPISLEEILRVSGAVGLSKDNGLFSAKNLGYSQTPTSDDLLMFGVEINDDKVFVHLYPLEVKIGYKDNNEIEKATVQICQTRKILDDNLAHPDNINALQTKVYRNFIAQLAVISAEKLNLYKVWEGQDWERIVNNDIRGKLLNDDFIITDSLQSKIGNGIIISFKDGAFIREVNTKDEVTSIKFLYSDGINYISKTVDEVYEDLLVMPTIKNHLFDCVNSGVDSLTEKPNPIICEDETDVAFDVSSEFLSSSQTTVLSESSETAEANTKKQPEDQEELVHETSSNSAKTDSEVSVEKSTDGMKILFGHDINSGEPLYWFPNDTEKIMHPNTGIIGTMGTGKTQFTKSLIMQLVKEQHNNPGDASIGILVFDYKGDYNRTKTDFIDATNAKVYDLYHLPFNPFFITTGSSFKPMLPLHTANTFKDTLSKCFGLGVKQETALRDCIMRAYESHGIDKSTPNTWDRTAPVLDEVFDIYMDRETFKEDSLYAALSALHEFEIFETDAAKTMPLYDMIDGVTVINLQGYDPSIQNLVVAITLDLFYSQMQANGHSDIHGKLRQLTKFILVDEADNFLKQGFPSLRKILKEGREFGVGTILSTQFLDHFDTQDDDFAKYILTWIVHRVDDLSLKNVRSLFNTTNKASEEELLSSIKQLAKHNSYVKLGNSSGPYYMKDRAFWELLQENTPSFS